MNRAGSDRPPGQAAPQRQLSLIDSTSIIVGIIIGSGLYETAPLVAQNVSGPGTLALVWIFGGIFALVGALCYGEMAAAYPAEGGDYVFLSRALGRRVGLVFAWTQLMVVRPGAVGAMAFIFARYASELLGIATQWMTLLAAAAVVMLSLVNMIGVRQAAWLQNVLTAAKVAGLLGVLALGMAAGGAGEAAGSDRPAGADFSVALILVLFAYSGWNEMAYVAAEVRNPQQNIVRALLAGTLSVVVLYLALNAAMVYRLGFEGLAGSQAAAADVVRPTLGPAGARAMSALVAVTALGAINGMTFTGSRIYYAFGRDHALFAALGRWSPKYGTPLRALLVEAAITLMMVIGLGWWYAHEGHAFQRLVYFTAPLFWFFLSLSALSLIVLRRRDPDRPRPFHVPLYPLTPLFFSAGSGLMCYASVDFALANRSWEALWPPAMLLVGMILCLVDRRRAA